MNRGIEPCPPSVITAAILGRWLVFHIWPKTASKPSTFTFVANFDITANHFNNPVRQRMFFPVISNVTCSSRGFCPHKACKTKLAISFFFLGL